MLKKNNGSLKLVCGNDLGEIGEIINGSICSFYLEGERMLSTKNEKTKGGKPSVSNMEDRISRSSNRSSSK